MQIKGEMLCTFQATTNLVVKCLVTYNQNQDWLYKLLVIIKMLKSKTKNLFLQGFSQPRSQDSLLPALRSFVGRVGENPGNEVGFQWILEPLNSIKGWSVSPPGIQV